MGYVYKVLLIWLDIFIYGICWVGERKLIKCILKYFDYLGIEVGREKNKGDFERSCNSCYDK